MTGRNRVGRTAQMTHLNRVFGAHVVAILTGQYEDPEGPGDLLPDPARRARARSGRASRTCCAGATARPPGEHDGRARSRVGPDAAVRDGAGVAARRSRTQGLLYGPAVNKLTLMNYVTPATVRALEWIGALVPELPHLYLTS